METSENTSANFHGYIITIYRVIAVIDVARSFARKKAKVYSRSNMYVIVQMETKSSRDSMDSDLLSIDSYGCL